MTRYALRALGDMLMLLMALGLIAWIAIIVSPHICPDGVKHPNAFDALILT